MRDAVQTRAELERQTVAPQSGRPLLEWVSLGRDVEKFLQDDPPPAEWVFRDFLRAGTVGGIVSRGGSGKSRLLLHMMLALAAGKPFGPFVPAGSRRVLYVCGEDPQDVLHERIHAIARGMGLYPGSKADILANFRAVSLQGTSCSLIGKSAAGNLATTAFHEWLCKSLESMGRVDLVVVDPMSRFFAGDENSNESGTAFISALEAIAKRAGCALLFAHHSSKSAVSNGSIKENTGRGASAIFDGARTMLSIGHRNAEELGVACQGGSDQGFIELAMTKANYGPLWVKPYFFQKGPGLLLTPTDPQKGIRGRQIDEIVDLLPSEGMTERAILKTNAGKAIRDALKESFPRIALKSELPLILSTGVELGMLERIEDKEKPCGGHQSYVYMSATRRTEPTEIQRKTTVSVGNDRLPEADAANENSEKVGTTPTKKRRKNAGSGENAVFQDRLCEPFCSNGNNGKSGMMPTEPTESQRKTTVSVGKSASKADSTNGKSTNGKPPFPLPSVSVGKPASEADSEALKTQRKSIAPTGR